MGAGGSFEHEGQATVVPRATPAIPRAALASSQTRSEAVLSEETSLSLDELLLAASTAQLECCRKCGTALIVGSSAFCRNCGQKRTGDMEKVRTSRPTSPGLASQAFTVQEVRTSSPASPGLASQTFTVQEVRTSSPASPGLASQDFTARDIDTSTIPAEYADVIDVLRSARYPARMEVTWALREPDRDVKPPLLLPDAVVSGQAVVLLNDSKDAETLVAMLSSWGSSGGEADERHRSSSAPAKALPEIPPLPFHGRSGDCAAKNARGGRGSIASPKPSPRPARHHVLASDTLGASSHLRTPAAVPSAARDRHPFTSPSGLPLPAPLPGSPSGHLQTLSTSPTHRRHFDQHHRQDEDEAKQQTQQQRPHPQEQPAQHSHPQVPQQPQTPPTLQQPSQIPSTQPMQSREHQPQKKPVQEAALLTFHSTPPPSLQEPAQLQRHEGLPHAAAMRPPASSSTSSPQKATLQVPSVAAAAIAVPPTLSEASQQGAQQKPSMTPRRRWGADSARSSSLSSAASVNAELTGCTGQSTGQSGGSHSSRKLAPGYLSRLQEKAASVRRSTRPRSPSLQPALSQLQRQPQRLSTPRERQLRQQHRQHAEKLKEAASHVQQVSSGQPSDCGAEQGRMSHASKEPQEIPGEPQGRRAESPAPGANAMLLRALSGKEPEVQEQAKDFLQRRLEEGASSKGKSRYAPQPRQPPPTCTADMQLAGTALAGPSSCGQSGIAQKSGEPIPASHVWGIAAGLQHQDAAVRRAAAVTLGTLRSAAAAHVGQLASALIDDPDAGVRGAAATAMGNIGKPAAGHAKALLAASLRDLDNDVRFHAAVSLGMLGESAMPHTKQLATALRNAGESARQAAAEALTSGSCMSQKSSEAWKRFQQSSACESHYLPGTK